MLLQGFTFAGTLGDQPVHIHLGQLLALWRSLQPASAETNCSLSMKQIAQLIEVMLAGRGG